MVSGGCVLSKITNLSILVGTGSCNASCNKCAGALLYKTLKYAADNGCRTISLTSSGEPTLSEQSVTMVLAYISQKFLDVFKNIHMYTNGIRIGEDYIFCNTFLYKWRQMGLTEIYLSVRSIDQKLNAGGFGIKQYPDFKIIFERIKYCGLALKCCITLQKGYIDTCDKFVEAVNYLFENGTMGVSAWVLKNADDTVSKNAPVSHELDLMEDWIKKSGKKSRFPEKTINLLIIHLYCFRMVNCLIFGVVLKKILLLKFKFFRIFIEKINL